MKKKLQTCLGRIEVNKKHPIGQVKGPFGISEKLQEIICSVGQSSVFEDGEEMVKEMMGVDISAKQIQRVSEYYGAQIENQIETNNPKVIPELQVKGKHDPMYLMLDGSMVYTRDDGWKEMKLSRMFYGSQNVQIQQDRSQIASSVYVSHLGNNVDFFYKLERYLIPYKNKVVIADGAKWIWNWVEDNYPGAVQILDFYHALEKLGQFSSHQFKQTEQRSQWMEEQKQRLLENEVDKVVEVIISLKPKNAEAKRAKEDVVRYYRDHEDRMQYKTYRLAGLLIGSGPIESAHRNVIQQRLKLSGQRWSIVGAQRIANLRTMKKSANWSAVIDLITNAA